MRAYNPLLLLILLLVTLTQPLAAQMSTPSPNDSGNDYGIDPGASYPGTIVVELLAAAEDEAVVAIDEAYAEGYKAGLLASAPDTAYWRTLANDWKAQTVAALSRPRLPWWSLPASIVGGLGVGFLVGVVAR